MNFFQTAFIKSCKEFFVNIRRSYRCTEAHSDPVKIFFVEIYLSIFKRFLSRNSGKLCAPRGTASDLGTNKICGLKIFNLCCIPARVGRCVETGNITDTAFPTNQGLPEGFLPYSYRGYNA